MTGAFVCFLDSYLLFFLFGLSDCLRIRGYFIKYPRIFHHVSMDISLRIHGYASFLLCPRDLLVVYSWVFSYWWFCFYSHKSHRSHEIFFHRWIFLSRETEFAARRGQRQSRESREVFFHRWFWSHTDLTNLTDGASLRPRLSASPSVCAPDGTREWNDACFVRFVRSVWDKFIGPGFRVFREIRVS